MRKSSIRKGHLSLEAIMRDYKLPKDSKNKLYFDLNSQRSAGVWDVQWKSDLIYSFLQGYTIPPIYIVKTGTENIVSMSVIDGKQRITSVREFLLDVFPMSKNTRPVVDEEGKEYNVAGLKFSQFPQELKEMLLQEEFEVSYYSDMTDDEIAWQMEKLNMQKPLNSTQRANVVIGEEMATAVAEATKNDLFEERVLLTEKKKNSGELKKMIFQSLMLYTGQDVCSLSGQDIEKHMKKNKVDKDTVDKIKEILDDLDSLLPRSAPVNENMNSTNIPILVMNYDKYEQMMDDGEITREDYKDFLKYWFEEGINSKAYQENVNRNGQSKKYVSGRLRVMDDALSAFMTERLAI